MDKGRPTDYRPEYDEQAKKLCKLGATDSDLADFFEVTEQTINNWKEKWPDFFESIKRGKVTADMEVADRLYQRALGFSHPEVDLKMYEGHIIETEIIKQYPPDPTSMIFWLKNRQPSKWRDKQDIDQKTEHSGNIGFTGINIIQPNEPSSE
jgi:DNA-binding XRE family transcriptional regulator